MGKRILAHAEARRILKYMRQWYLYFEKSQQIVGQITQIPWGHNIVIVTKIKNGDEAIFYINKVKQEVNRGG